MSFREYVEHGWVLCPIREGEKAPRGSKWNTRENGITNPERAAGLDGAGLCHAFSGTCAIDIDNMDYARAWLAERGVDLDALFADPQSVQITRGDATRGKLLYALPVPLPTKQIKSEDKTFVILEFRCGATTGNTAQDVLPPTRHPSGKLYSWKYDSLTADWRELPPLPESLHRIWLGLVQPAIDRSQIVSPIVSTAGLEELRELIADYDPDMTHDEWVRIGAILHHETEGSDAGLALWDEWSSKGSKYKGFDELAYKWSTFGNSTTPVTAGSLRRTKKATRDDFEDAPIGGDLDLDAAEHAADAAKRDAAIASIKWNTPAELVSRPPPEWLVYGIIPRTPMGMVWGPSGAGKSFAVLDACLTIVRGAEFWLTEDRTVKRGAVGWLAAEAEGSLTARLKAYCKRHEIDPTALADFYELGNNIDFTNIERIRAIAESAKQFSPALVVLDTVSAASPGVSENSDEMKVVFANAAMIHEITGATVLLIHHSGYDETHARGWTGMKAWVEFELMVAKADEQGALRNITIKKNRDGEEGKVIAFGLSPVTIGLDDKDRPIVSAVVEHREVKAPRPKREEQKTTERSLAYSVLEALWPVDGEPVIQLNTFLDAYADELPRALGDDDKRHKQAHDALTKLAKRKEVDIDNARGTITLLKRVAPDVEVHRENNEDLI